MRHDRGGRPADGTVVEASVVARVLGIRLLTLDAIVAIAPAEVRARAPVPRDVQVRPSARPVRALPARSGAIGRGLADAVRAIDEGAAILAEARRSGVASAPARR